jgi:hypothetical protein
MVIDFRNLYLHLHIDLIGSNMLVTYNPGDCFYKYCS